MANMDQKSSLRSIRFTSWNVRGLGGPVRRTHVLSNLKNMKTDIAFLQETHLRVSDHFRLRRPWVGQVFHSGLDSCSRGTAILLHKRLQFSMEHNVSDPHGCFVIVVGTLLHTPVFMVCVYTPTWDCPNFITSLFSLIPCLDSHHLIFGGDLNLVIKPNLNKSNPKNLTPSNMTLMNQMSCVDVCRDNHPTTKEFLFYSHVHLTYSRIDYFFLEYSFPQWNYVNTQQ